MQNYFLRECCVKWYLLSVCITEMHKVYLKLWFLLNIDKSYRHRYFSFPSSLVILTVATTY